MNLSVLSILCCPSCRGDLGVADNGGRVEVIEEGTVRCQQCAAEYQIRAGILNFISSEQGGPQNVERENRDNVAREYENADVSQTLTRVTRHHYVPTMKRAVRSFSSKFSRQDWVLDIGAGWGWHWLGVVVPNIVAMDFSFDSLLVAKNVLGSQVDKNVHLVCADAARLPVKDGAVDGIWTVQALQHIPQTTLKQCLALWAAVCKGGGYAEIYWLNWSVVMRALQMLLGRKVDKEATDPYYLRYITCSELRDLLRVYLGRVTAIGYNEVIFHPEMRLTHRLPLAWLDQGIGKVPFLNRVLARQIVAKVHVRP